MWLRRCKLAAIQSTSASTTRKLNVSFGDAPQLQFVFAQPATNSMQIACHGRGFHDSGFGSISDIFWRAPLMLCSSRRHF
jgi:hypothetical protein